MNTLKPGISFSNPKTSNQLYFDALMAYENEFDLKLDSESDPCHMAWPVAKNDGPFAFLNDPEWIGNQPLADTITSNTVPHWGTLRSETEDLAKLVNQGFISPAAAMTKLTEERTGYKAFDNTWFAPAGAGIQHGVIHKLSDIPQPFYATVIVSKTPTLEDKLLAIQTELEDTLTSRMNDEERKLHKRNKRFVDNMMYQWNRLNQND